jgi:type II secretory ATPase GspE/PulE/Tfp pilus assembly ATPase PilB-like protein/CheY-like chemotaxis protein
MANERNPTWGLPAHPNKLANDTRAHWLKDVASHVGLDLRISEYPDLREIARAWPVVGEACGLSDEGFTQRVGGYFRLGIADPSTYDPQAVRLIPESVARLNGVLALSATETNIVVATSDPSKRSVIGEIIQYSGRQPVFLISSPSKLAEATERAYAPARAPRNALQTLVAQVAASDPHVVATDFQILTGKDGKIVNFDIEEPSLVKLTNFIIGQALKYRATEIHIEPGAREGRVRYRIDGVLQHVVELPKVAHARLVARIKYLQSLEAGGSPEYGFTVKADDIERQAVPISTPSPEGDLLWIRLNDKNVPSLESLNYDGPEGAKIRKILQRKDGLVLVTGPARSGTSSFVYAALASFKKQSVMALEGRPELVIPGVTQIRFEAREGFSFAEALQQLLDRSPDVLYAGEIRDLATARTVLRTAVTGRKVIATAHTSDAISGIRRLIEMGLAPRRLAESLPTVISLRLVRRLCDQCARPFNAQKDTRSREAVLAGQLRVRPVRMSVGCKACGGTGYLNQIPLAEIFQITPAIREAVSTNPSDADLLRAARSEGMRTFVEIGLDRVSRGETTVEEVERVLEFVPTRDETAESVGAVLVIEDEVDDRVLISAILRQMGFRVLEVASSAAAQEVLKSPEDLCLVILDVYLPLAEGPDLLRSIRRSLSTQALPVIVVTGSDNPHHELELLDAGADDYLLKPVIAERLQSRVRAVLRRSGVRIDGFA